MKLKCDICGKTKPEDKLKLVCTLLVCSKECDDKLDKIIRSHSIQKELWGTIKFRGIILEKCDEKREYAEKNPSLHA